METRVSLFVISERHAVLKKKIRYENLDGDTVEDTFYFHYNQAELAKIKLTYGDDDGDVAKYFTALLKSGDRKAIIEAFDGLILGAYGERSLDGKRFEKKNGELAREFSETEAYSALFMELISDGGKAFQAFLRGVLPSGLQDKLDEETKLQERVATATARIQQDGMLNVELPKIELPTTKPEPETKDDTPPWVREGRPPNKEELMAMTPEQINRAFYGQK